MPTDIKLYQMFGGEKVCEFLFLFFRFVCFFLGRGGGGGDVWVKNCSKKREFFLLP